MEFLYEFRRISECMERSNYRMIQNRKWKPAIAVLIFCLLVYGLLFMDTPYVIQKAGTAEDVGSMVKVNNPDVAEGSVFMLTTVRQMYPNWMMYTVAHFKPEWEIYEEKILRPNGESRTDYNERQAMVMLSSQSNALHAAYTAAHIPFHVEHQGVVINSVVKGMPAEGVLHVGDIIVEFNGKKISRSDDVYEWVTGKKVGDSVEIGFKRGDALLHSTIVMGDYARLPNSNGEIEEGLEAHPGLGIAPIDVADIRADNPDQQVTIDVEDIGGPSAGLIFTLEIIDQLTSGDLTKGYRIAGTGTISPEGIVGPIGGVQHKIVAANRENAQIFFVPQENAKDATARANELKLDMKIVPVTTVDDALDYLRDIPIITK
jgi:PDZ domain-containing protein